MESIQGKTGLITGATSGIGLALSLLLLKSGAKLYLLGRSFDKLREMILESGEDFEYKFLKMDLEEKDLINSLKGALKEEKSIDFVIHCAGYISLGSFIDSNLKDFDKHFDINVRSPYIITKHLLEMLEKRKGQILFMNSTAGLSSWQGIGQYASSKHALRSIADSLRKEMSGKGVKVTSVFLGSVDTPMQKRVQKLRGNKYKASNFMDANDVASFILNILTLPFGTCVSEVTLVRNN
jgi:short-subunit dehydrogenase